MAQKYEAIINYGLQNKKSKQEIISALIKENEFNNAGTYIKQLDEFKAFGSEKPEQPDLSSASSLERQSVADIDSTIQMSREAKEMLQGLSTGPLAGRVQGAKQMLPGGGDEKFNKLDAKLSNIKSNFMKALSGAAVSEQEVQRLSKFLPSVTDQEEVIKIKLEALESELSNRKKNTFKSLGIDAPESSDVEPQQQVADRLNKAVEYAKANPDDPQSQRFMDDWSNNRIDLTTGKLKDDFRELTPYEQKLKEQSPTLSPTTAEQSPTAEISQKPDDNFKSRLWEATKSVIPGLTEDIGKRLKNIWSNVSEQSTQAKEGSVFSDIIKGQETNFRNLGQVAGGIGDVAVRAVELAYKSGVPKETQEAIKNKASELMQTETGQQAMQALQQGAESWKGFKDSNPNIAKDIEAAVNIITAVPLGKGLKVVGGEAKAIAGDTLKVGSKLIGADGTEAASKQVFQAVKPSLTVARDKKTIRETLNIANDEIVSRGIKPTNLKEYSEAIAETKKKVWTDIESKLSSAGENVKISVKTISDKLKEIANSPTLLRADEKASKAINKMADSLVSQGDDMPVLEAEKLKQFINAELSGAFGKFNLSNAEQNAKKLITKQLGEQLDSALSKVPGEFADLKKKYGSLRQIEEDVLKRVITFERQNPQGLVESFSKISGIGNILKGFVPGGGGVSSVAKGVGELALGQIQKRANDADLLVKKAFEKLYKSKQGFSPESKTFQTLKDKMGLTAKDISSNPKFVQMQETLKNLERQWDKTTNQNTRKTIEKAISKLMQRIQSID